MVSSFIHSVLTFFEGLGYWGIMLGLMIEIIPSEIVLAYAGYLVFNGSISFLGAVIFGTIGGGRPILERYGKYIFIHKKQIDAAEDWFNRYGTGVIFTARFIPVVRHAISIPAGITKMSFLRFTTLTALAIIPWSIIFIYLGEKLGENWENINDVAGPYVKSFAIGGVILILLYFVIKKWTKKRKNLA